MSGGRVYLRAERDNQTVGLTNIELEKGGTGEGGVVESLSCDLRVGERQSVVWVLEEGEGRAC